MALTAEPPPLPKALATWLTHLAERSHLDAWVPQILAATWLTNVLEADPDQPMVPGGSRIGGQPDLLSAADWPVVHGAPLRFVAQLRLADLLVHGPLPSRGVLAFFVGEQEQAKVLFTQERPRDLTPTSPPADIPQSAGCAVLVHRGVVIDQIAGLSLSQQRDLDLLRTATLRALPGGDGGARVLGLPQGQQALLLQLRDPLTDALLQFTIAASALRKKAFDQVRLRRGADLPDPTQPA